MSSDFILGCPAGGLFIAIAVLVVQWITDIECGFGWFCLKFKKIKKYINVKNIMIYIVSLVISLLINIFIWSQVINLLGESSNRYVIGILVIVCIIHLYIDGYVYFNFKNAAGVERIAYNFAANIGLFSFFIGMVSCFKDNVGPKAEILTYGGIFIAIGSFFMMLFIALFQLLENQQKDKFKN